jgi:hypothetical protein
LRARPQQHCHGKTAQRMCPTDDVSAWERLLFATS